MNVFLPKLNVFESPLALKKMEKASNWKVENLLLRRRGQHDLTPFPKPVFPLKDRSG